MRRLVPSTCLVSIICTATAAAQNPRDIVARGLDAIGGEAAARNLTGMTQEFYLVSFGLGQSETPASPPRASVSTGRIVSDWRGGRRLIVQEIRGPGGAVTAARAVLVGGSGAAGNPGQQTPLSAVGVAAQQRSLRTTPHRLLLAALDAGAALAAAPAREFRGRMHDGVRLAAADTVTLYFDRATGLLTVGETTTDDPILGDRVTQTWFTRWQAAGGTQFPRQIDTFVNGQLSSHLITTAASAETAPADSLFAAPDSILRRPPAPAPAIAVRLVELAPGVWRAEGGTHHSLVVEQAGQLVLVEAPQSTQRVRALLDTLRARWPARPVGVAVMTHHHWDHAGGIREIVAAGIPVATHEINTAFVRQVAAARRTVAPDLQAQRRRAPVVRSFADSLVLGGGDERVVLYRQPTTHVEGMLTAWVPAAGVLFTSDVLAGGGATLATPGSAEMAALARSRGLAPRWFAGGHGTVVPWADVERAAAR
jgi:glyoxylase-like metal-dependent hydrolase (beta-lactamase superfamily II)